MCDKCIVEELEEVLCKYFISSRICSIFYKSVLAALLTT